jgi:Tol biopolymer transport system component
MRAREALSGDRQVNGRDRQRTYSETTDPLEDASMFHHGSQHPAHSRFRAPGFMILAALALVGCGAGGDALAPAEDDVAAAPVETTPAALVTGQRIAFTSTRNGGYDIYKMAPSGQSLVRLTSSKDWEFSPGWSRGNGRIAFTRERHNGVNPVRYDIYVTNADGSNGHWAMPLASGYDVTDPDWSPDGSQLVVTVSVSGIWYIGYINLADGRLGLYTTNYKLVPGRYPSYTKAGQIIYTGPTGSTVDRINADGSNHKTLLTSAAGASEPALSPDGKKLLYERVVDTFNLEIYVKDLVSGTTKRLTNNPASDAQGTWSPDGSRIAFTSTRSGQQQIWTMDANGGTLTRITHTATAERDPAWTH